MGDPECSGWEIHDDLVSFTRTTLISPRPKNQENAAAVTVVIQRPWSLTARKAQRIAWRERLNLMRMTKVRSLCCKQTKRKKNLWGLKVKRVGAEMQLRLG